MKIGESIGREVAFIINGREEKVFCRPGETLLEVLRNRLDHTEVKEGCGQGDCGVCTVLLNGRPVDACLVLAYKAEGREITTVKGLGTRTSLHPLQEQFLEKGAVQCGFCTPGMLLSAKALLDRKPHPTIEEIKRSLSGNLCRCTGYTKIVEAVAAAAGSVPLGGEDRVEKARGE
ncbi:MAG: (2Fe-2S)-binding protein [Thermodesulfobacteriota bacterium]